MYTCGYIASAPLFIEQECNTLKAQMVTMKVLVLNTGSSSLKYDLVDVDVEADTLDHPVLASGTIELRGKGAASHGQDEADRSTGAASVQSYAEAVEQALASLGSQREEVEAVGHRVVHGGDTFDAPVVLDTGALEALEGLNDLAPLHNPAAVEAIRAARNALGTDAPMVAVFDTTFHSSLPDHAYTYALSLELAERHGVRRYGFHGIAHEYMLRRYAQLEGIAVADATIITLQLGNGCSAAAIRNGRSVDTSMGFTPLEGLVMGTRSGDIDPGLFSYLSEREGWSAQELEDVLNKRSGLLGISGLSSDMRTLLDARETDGRVKLAIDIFCYRVRKYIGAYLAVLGGADALVFGGGIGENATYIRARICEGFDWCGLRLEAAKNEAARGTEGRIGPDDALIAAYVVAVREEELIAASTAKCLYEARSLT